MDQFVNARCASCQIDLQLNGKGKSIFLIDLSGAVIQIVELEEKAMQECPTIELHEKVCVSREECFDKYTSCRFVKCRSCGFPLGKFYLSATRRTQSKLRKCVLFSSQLLLADQDQKKENQPDDYANPKSLYLAYSSANQQKKKEYISFEFSQPVAPFDGEAFMKQQKDFLDSLPLHERCKHILHSRIQAESMKYAKLLKAKQKLKSVIEAYASKLSAIRETRKAKPH